MNIRMSGVHVDAAGAAGERGGGGQFILAINPRRAEDGANSRDARPNKEANQE